MSELRFSIIDKIKCLERELALRKSAYTKWVEEGRLHVDRAAHEIGCVRAMIADYRAVLSMEDGSGRPDDTGAAGNP